MTTENKLTTDETGKRDDAHISLPSYDQPVRLRAGEDGEDEWHKDVPQSMRTSPWLSMATTFVIGSLCIRTFSLRPSARKRMATLGVVTAYTGWSQYKDTVIATRLTGQYRVRDAFLSGKLSSLTSELSAKNLAPSELVAGRSSDPEAANLWRTMWLLLPSDTYNFPDEDFLHQRYFQRSVLTLKAGVGDIVPTYRLRDTRRSNELGLRDRLAYEWRKSGSSVELRAALEEWLLLPALSESGEEFVDQDLGRCSAFFANLIASRQTAKTFLRQERIADITVKGAAFAAVLFPVPWVMWPAGVAGLCALAWSVPTQLRWVQNTQEHLYYSSPHAGAVMHCTMLAALKRVDVPTLKQILREYPPIEKEVPEHSAESDTAASNS